MIRLLIATGAVFAIVFSLATSIAFDWRIVVPLAVLAVPLIVLGVAAQLRTFLLAVLGLLPWCMVVGSDYLHAPFISLIPYARFSTHLLQVMGGMAVLCVLEGFLFWIWYSGVTRAYVLSPLLRMSLLWSLVAVYSVLFPFRFGGSWAILASLSIACFVLLRYDGHSATSNTTILPARP